MDCITFHGSMLTHLQKIQKSQPDALNRPFG